jgi:hypothetical protein
MKMKSNVFLGCAVLLIFGVLLGCATTQRQGVYDGIGVWLVTETNFNAWKNANYQGQPTPTALSHIEGDFSALSANFSVQLKEPYDYGNGKGWWNVNQQGTNWTAVSGDYYVFLIPMYWSSGVSGRGNMEWRFEAGKVSAADGNFKNLNITSTRALFSLADFQNVSEISY